MSVRGVVGRERARAGVRHLDSRISFAPASDALAPAAELLVECLRARFDVAARERLRTRFDAARDEAIEWARLPELADRHGVTPLVFLQADALATAAPPEVIEALRAGARRNTARQLLLAAELRAIVDALAQAGVCAVPFKGPALAHSVYGNLALRESRDLDLLVRRADVTSARRVLADRGYAPDTPLSPAAEAAQLRTGNDLELRRGDGLMVELHWSVLHRYFAFPLESRCFDRLACGTLLGREIAGLSPEDQLLALCAHGTKHAWERLVWICDVAELLRRYPGLDWALVWREAERLGAVRAVRLGLRLAEWLGFEPLDPVRRRVRADRRIARLATRVVAAIEAPEGASRTAWKSAFHFLSRDRFADAVRYGVRRAFLLNANDWMSATLPDALHALYYPMRLLRLLGARIPSAAAANRGRRSVEPRAMRSGSISPLDPHRSDHGVG